MTATEAFIAELREEAEATRRVLERIPEAKLSWKPHPKSMSLGQLAMHVAVLPLGIAELLSEEVREIPVVPLPEAASVAELLAALDRSIAVATAKLVEWGDAGLRTTWKLTRNGETLFELPRTAMIRTIMLNHGYHHRGQLTVYLRLLDVAVPFTYGPTADENPFG